MRNESNKNLSDVRNFKPFSSFHCTSFSCSQKRKQFQVRQRGVQLIVLGPNYPKGLELYPQKSHVQ